MSHQVFVTLALPKKYLLILQPKSKILLLQNFHKSFA
jgi:hypothetical protein